MLLLAALSGCSQRGCKTTATNDTQHRQALSIDTASFRAPIDTVKLGRIGEGEQVSRTVVVRNAADRPLVAFGSHTTCGCLRIALSDRPVMPDSTVSWQIDLDSTLQGGEFVRRIEVFTSLSDSPLVLIVEADIR